MATLKLYRVAFLAVFVVFSGITVVDFATGSDTAGLEEKVGTQIAEPQNGTTVITTHLQHQGRLLAIGPDGNLTHYNDTYDGYWDVDPSPLGADTVLYTATNRLSQTEECKATVCRLQVIERANLSTGETTRLYERIGVPYSDAEWHDVDRINDTHVVVADMAHDSVFILDMETGIKTWEWETQSYLPLSTGGPYPKDWVHLNDVEVLDDGRIMASLRNQDQVVFLNRNGVIQNWTLGADDNTDILFEQHNPDYIPAERGGPALLVADSENNRVVEYQREGNNWNQTWIWQDAKTQWTRDADRLPGGNTLITDTHGERVLEIDESGDIVWQFPITAYEAERLETGDESAGGQSAAKLNLTSVTPGRQSSQSKSENLGITTRLRRAITKPLPNKVINGIAAVSPPWMSFFGVVGLVFAILDLLVWTGFECWHSGYRLRSPLFREAHTNPNLDQDQDQDQNPVPDGDGDGNGNGNGDDESTARTESESDPDANGNPDTDTEAESDTERGSVERDESDVTNGSAEDED